MSIVKRYEKNPILTKDDIPYPVATVHNAGVTKYNGQYIMLFRSHLTNGRSILGLARSENGYDFKAESKPFMTSTSGGVFGEYEEYGVEDPRITFIDGEYLITYSAYSRHGVRIGLAKTKDFMKLLNIIVCCLTVIFRNLIQATVMGEVFIDGLSDRSSILLIS
ncbi:MAG: hypothetical protein GY771_15195, partial [bacterium]|nr:hypothetical protein [bacterium]